MTRRPDAFDRKLAAQRAARASEWTCKTCGATFVVPVLARDCERKHR